MPKVKFEDGTVINFESIPSQQDIDEAYNSVKGQNKSTQKNPELISTLLNINKTPEQLAREGHWVQGGLLKTGEDIYREKIAPLMEGSSTLAFGIPRLFARSGGAEKLLFPEQQTPSGKILRGGFETAGFMGGGIGQTSLRAGERLIPRLVTKEGMKLVEPLGRKVLRGATEGAVAGALLPPSEGYIAPVERGKQALTFGAISGGLPVVGATAKGVGTGISKAGRGVAKIIGGITDSTVTTIKRLGANRVFDPLKANADYISQNLAPRVYKGFENFVNSADEAYKSAVDKFKGNSINSQPFYQTIQRGLRDKGWIDLRGNPTTRYKSGLDPITDKLTALYESMRAPTEGVRLTGKIINKEDFFTYRDALSSMIRERPSDRLVMQARNALYDSAEKSGMAGIKTARDLERKVFDIENKIDIRKITADLVKAKNPQYTKVIQSEYEDLVKNGILSKEEYTNLFDDLMAHFANIDFNLVSETPGTGGGIYTGMSGIRKAIVGGATKQYYKNIEPAISSLKGKIGQGIEEAQGIGKGIFGTPTLGKSFSGRTGIGNKGSTLTKSLIATGLGGLTLGAGLRTAQAAQENLTLGQKNNNPINLKATEKWQGMTGKDKFGHAQFQTLDDGIRAGLVNLRTHQLRNPEETLRKYMRSFKTAKGDYQAEYIAKKLGIIPDTKMKNLDMYKIIIPLAQIESKIKLTKEQLDNIKDKFKLNW